MSFSFKSNFFVTKEPFKTNDLYQKHFLEDLGLLIIKNHLLLQFVENIWSKQFSMHLCPRLFFLSTINFLMNYYSNEWEK
jgi:hypothetical protein